MCGWDPKGGGMAQHPVTLSWPPMPASRLAGPPPRARFRRGPGALRCRQVQGRGGGPAATEPARLAADLFDILLPMLNIYQEFVRNHQYSLQILAHCKQNRDFDKLLKHYEAKPDCEERTLETFLTYPMFQVRPARPRLLPGASGQGDRPPAWLCRSVPCRSPGTS